MPAIFGNHSTEEAVEAAKSFQVIPNSLFDSNLEFWQCMDCNELYWEMTELVDIACCVAGTDLSKQGSREFLLACIEDLQNVLHHIARSKLL
ncbi:hypothetical protein Vadar_021878 [Vaccinium darrowii]|uniref:Uncharacterized protein n=1 Tax=Vaccinium darrowii TaxID=229202 RepID=A0ACB7Y0Y1_9ERIC|nr:hypothetical protein Vadar_021878 [Vaccinium darrowii]